MSKKGVLLINLGTPDHHDTKSVGRYLRHFLQDKRVIDLPFFIRMLLVNCFIVPWRRKKTALAYKKIWLTESPLRLHSNDLQECLMRELGPHYQIELGMRYGNPSIKNALNQLKRCNEIIILPLFPQYSSAATGSALEVVLKQIGQFWNIPNLSIKTHFYNDSGFISAYATLIESTIRNEHIDILLFSYHGLPERHINKSCDSACSRLTVCPNINDKNVFCYRAQCYATSHLLAKELNLLPHQYSVSFQSRLGHRPWIKPYTDLLLPELIKKGIKNIAIVCPSFVADCLETLEEVNIRTREQWQSLGGNKFIFIPCLNTHLAWIHALREMILTKN